MWLGFFAFHNMDVVIPYQHSINNDAELRYALRSAVQHIPGLDYVYIVGDPPAWSHKNVIHLPYQQNTNPYYKDANIALKILHACHYPGLSHKFVILHDDNFLLDTFHADTYYHKGNTWQSDTVYAQVEQNTRRLFGPRIFNYDLHAPHAVNKQAFVNTVGALDWRVPYGYCIKTAYACMNHINGTYCPDLKINAPFPADELQAMLRGRKWFSIGDTFIKPHTLKLLEQLYPIPTRYEQA